MSTSCVGSGVSSVSGLTNLVNDLTPQLGGNLDGQDFKIFNVDRIGTNITSAAGILANLHADGVDGIISRGTISVGTEHNLGPGVRLHWYPRQAAFRAGQVNGTQWDSTGLGFNSAAFGINTTAFGIDSFAVNNTTFAEGNCTSCFGLNTRARSFASIVMGRFNLLQGTSGSWIDTDPLLVLGNGANAGLPSNALTVLKNGSMVLGSHIISSDIFLKLDTTTKGFLKPVPTTVQRLAIGTPSSGLEVYDSDLKQPFYFNGTSWESVSKKLATRTVVFADSPVAVILTDEVILCDTALGDITINMLASATMNKPIFIKKISASNKVVIDPNTSETIDLATTLELIGSSPLPGVMVQPDGSNLFIL